MAATGHRKLQRGAWLATPRIRSDALSPTPHRAEDTGKVVNGFRNRLKYLAVSRPFPQYHAVARRTGMNGGIQSNQTRSLARRHDGRRPVLSEHRSPHRLACGGAAPAGTESTSDAGHGEIRSVTGHKGFPG